MRIVRRWLLSLAIAGLSLGAVPGFADPVTSDSKAVVTAPSWIVGSNWYYSDGYALKVTSSTQGATVFDRLDAPGQWFSRQGFLRKDLTSGTATRTSIYRTIPDLAGMVLRAGSPLTFQREYLENGALMVHASSWSVEGRETITVPAGTFDCWIIVWRSRSLRSDWTGFERWWYSPQAQHYVRMEYKYGADAEGSRVLMRYQIGAQPAQNAPGVPAASLAPVEIPKAAPAAFEILPPATVQPLSSTPATRTEAAGAVQQSPPSPAATNASPTSADPGPSKPSSPVVQHAAANESSATTQDAAADIAVPAQGGASWHAQVASSKQEVAVRKSLDKILRQHAGIVGNIASGVAAVRIKARGVFYRAWLGDFQRSADATSLCRALRASGTACSVSKSAPGEDERLASNL